VRLLRSFLVEQTHPDLFYGDLAADTVQLVRQHAELDGASVLDVGSGPVQFARAFQRAGACYVGLDVSAHTVATTDGASALVGVGERLPFADDCLDVVLSSNVMEHVPQPGHVAAEMLRVVRPGGLVVITYTAWYSFWGGHETAPWHYLGGEYAARRYERRHGQGPKNRFGRTMYPAHVGPALRWARRQQAADVLFAGPRYHPWWALWVSRVPGLREVATWNLLLVLRRRPGAHGEPFPASATDW
jgi:SAM-dependent methyltransferase